MIYKPEEMRQDLLDAIQACVAGEGMVRLAWVCAKLVKHGRQRCRNNTALNNYLAKVFTELRFEEVPKEYKGRRYMGLKITHRVTGECAEATDDESED